MSDESKDVEKWLKKIKKSEEKYEDYHKLVKDIREYYKNEHKKTKTNIFWSSIETLKPFIYFKQPKPYIERKEKAYNPVEACACKILEKALEWNLAQFDFDGIIKYVRNDYLVSGCGLAYERYAPSFRAVGDIEIKAGERVETVYIDPVKFIADCENVGIWEDCTWFAIRIDMTADEAIRQFGREIEPYLAIDLSDSGKEQKLEVYEIWDKAAQNVKYLCKDCKSRFLRKTDNVFGVDGFFTMPKPMFATLINDGIIPIPDYVEIKSLLDEMDGVNRRMRLTMQALKVSGCYDNSFPELANILDKDVSLVSLSDFARLKEAGGIKGIIDFMPIDQYITALTSLAERRQDLVAQIYEVTGVSDIMRGNSDANETATAVRKKTNFGTLRNQDRQNDMQRFITDLFKIKAEIICEQFSAETLIGFLGQDEKIDPQIVMDAIALLKTDKMRGMALGIETDTSFNQEEIALKTTEAVKMINDMVNTSFQSISAQPLLLPLYRKMVESVVATLPNSRQFEAIIEEVFDNIHKQLSEPEPQKPDVDEQKVQIQAQKNQNDFMIKQEQNQIKRDELALKKQVEDNKVQMTNKEAEMQFALEKAKLATGQNISGNITTGYVGDLHV